MAYSTEWAAPIVAVPMKDGHFRICGHYKVTANQALDTDQYPLPRPDDLFSIHILAEGDKFSKLDLSQAYQQHDPGGRLCQVRDHKYPQGIV